MKPTFIDNRAGRTFLSTLATAIPTPTTSPGLAEAPPTLSRLSIATGFVTPSGFAAIADRLDQAATVRLLLGAEAEPEAVRQPRMPEDPPGAARDRALVAAGLRALETGLRRARDAEPFSLEAHSARHRMIRMLREKRIETRRYERHFLHAKAMILDGLDPGLIVGSSNLSLVGLTGERELNLGTWDPAVSAQGNAWFDALWNDALPFDLASLFAEPDEDYPPFLIYLRILLQLYGDELDQETAEAGEIPLTAFQLHGVWRANRILNEFGGVLIADEVGLGKTYIGGAMVDACAKARQTALIVCPAALRRGWARFLDVQGISRKVDLVSFDQLARDRRLPDERRPLATALHLKFDPDEYALVVVDEAHGYRNRDSAYRGAVLAKLLEGAPRKNLVLMTATPVNNSLWDLFHLLRYFLRQDGALAHRGIPKLRDRFRAAAKQDPAELSPDLLYPVIDAVTVKRTRGFVKRFYSDATITGADGVARPIVFPQAVPITLRYDLDAAVPGLFAQVADALDPANGANLVSFARYAPDRYRIDRDPEMDQQAEGVAGLLRSGLLKRFESSAHAFRLSLSRMVKEHELFLGALERGRVIGTGFLREVAADEDAFDELLSDPGRTEDARDYAVTQLREAVARDRDILAGLCEGLDRARQDRDPKLDAVVEALATIAHEARLNSGTEADERRNRKVLLFSYFADTVDWLRGALRVRIDADPRLQAWRGRVVAVAGGGLADEEADRTEAVWGFAPQSSDPPDGQADLFDLLIGTDVLAEGLNLQQCRHIINYDLPWNPMRLVQRHGRIDRIGSPHRRVFLRTVFPAGQLDALLTLEQRILRKLSQAAASIGVATLPVDGASGGTQVFAETRREIEKLAAGDGSIFERGGTVGGAQTGEEYRLLLRAAMQARGEAISRLAGHAGSGMRKGMASGVLFCAEVATRAAKRSFLRFIRADIAWRPRGDNILKETATCLRIAECAEGTARHVPDSVAEQLFAFWNVAREDILEEWDRMTDPATMQPQVRRLNREVAAFMRANPPPGVTAARFGDALDILESPWPLREEGLLRDQFRDRSGSKPALSRRLVEWIPATGLEKCQVPPPYPPIEAGDVRMVCWMAIQNDGTTG